jgi:hypothetical protein
MQSWPPHDHAALHAADTTDLDEMPPTGSSPPGTDLLPSSASAVFTAIATSRFRTLRRPRRRDDLTLVGIFRWGSSGDLRTTSERHFDHLSPFPKSWTSLGRVLSVLSKPSLLDQRCDFRPGVVGELGAATSCGALWGSPGRGLGLQELDRPKRSRWIGQLVYGVA